MPIAPDDSTTPSAPLESPPDAGTGERGGVHRLDHLDQRSPEDDRVAELVAHTIDVPQLASAVVAQDAADAADALETIDPHEVVQVLSVMPPQSAADALGEMETPLGARVLEIMDECGGGVQAGELLSLMPSDDAADLLRAIDDEAARERILSAVPLPAGAGLRQLCLYDEDTAGGMMTIDHPVLTAAMTVQEARGLFRRTMLPEDVMSVPVVDGDHRVRGVVGLRDLLTSEGDTSIAVVMDDHVVVTNFSTDAATVVLEFTRYGYSMLPVVDDDDRLVGIVTFDDAMETMRHEQTEDVLRTVGAGPEEAVYSSVPQKVRGRLPWLIVSGIIMVPAMLIVLQFEGLISQMAILAVLMPLIAALAGNAGHQSLAVTLRGLTLQEVRTGRVAPLLRRELTSGLVTGFGLGAAILLLLGLLGHSLEGAGWRLGIVAGAALMVSMAIGSLAGACVPLAMRRCGVDPAQASAIFLVMVTDAVSFATLLGLTLLTLDWVNA